MQKLISFRVDKELEKQIESEALRQERKLGNFCRLIIKKFLENANTNRKTK